MACHSVQKVNLLLLPSLVVFYFQTRFETVFELHFHRIIKNFMIQFGCPFSKDPNSPKAGTGGPPHGTIADEHRDDAKFSNELGTLAMANRGPNSGGSQFFINSDNNNYLDWFTPGPSKHPVFGKVIQGMDIVRLCDMTPTTKPVDRPITPVRVSKITVNGY